MRQPEHIELPDWICPSGKGTDTRLTFRWAKSPDANPYYVDNSQLFQAASLLANLPTDQLLVVEDFSGGHRRGLQDDCRLILNFASHAARETVQAWADSLAGHYSAEVELNFIEKEKP